MCGRVKGHHSGAAVNTVTSQQNNFRVWLRAFLCGVCVLSLCPYRLIHHNLECEWEGFVFSHFWKIVCKFKVRFSVQQGFFCVCLFSRRILWSSGLTALTVLCAKTCSLYSFVLLLRSRQFQLKIVVKYDCARLYHFSRSGGIYNTNTVLSRLRWN